MKKEYLLLIVAIIGLAALLVYQKKGQTNYQLPKLAEIDVPVDRVVLEEGDHKVELRQVDGNWVVGPKSYRADNARAAKMVDEIRKLQLVALVSEKENYQLYELNEKKRFTVKLFHGKELLREVMIGKNSASLRQTYVMLKDDRNVYQALGNLKSNLFAKISDLRDKEVVKLPPAEREKIDRITLERVKDGKKELLELVKITPEPETDSKTEAQSDSKSASETKAKEPKSATVAGWQQPDGTPVAAAAVSGLLNAMTDLKCKDYLEDLSPDEFKEPAYRIVVKGGETELSIAFLDIDGNEFRALSSQVSQPFLLPSWQAKKMVKDFTDYTGAKKPAPSVKK
jgi:hypothetical protein